MLTDAFYRDYRVLPTPWMYWGSYAFYRSWMAATRTTFRAEGWESIPDRPCLIATNSTQNQDFMALRTVAALRGVPCVTVTKAKNYHSAIMGFALGRLGVVPIASKGYLILVDATRVLGRRPTDAEYRALRDHVDHGQALPSGALEAVRHRARSCFGVPFEPTRQPYRDWLRDRYRDALRETVRLAREAVDAGCHVQMYPEGTVSPTLGTGRIGAVQLAVALGLPLLPVGMSGCPEAFIGSSPLTRGGTVTVRVGQLMELPPDLMPAGFRPFDPDDEAANRPALQAVTDALMDRIDGLLDPPYRRDPNSTFVGKGTRALL